MYPGMRRSIKRSVGICEKMPTERSTNRSMAVASKSGFYNIISIREKRPEQTSANDIPVAKEPEFGVWLRRFTCGHVKGHEGVCVAADVKRSCCGGGFGSGTSSRLGRGGSAQGSSLLIIGTVLLTFVLQYQVHMAIELRCIVKLHKVFCSRRSGPISHIFPPRDHHPRRLSPAVVRILGRW
jgi:hypothetical protein